MLVDFFIQSDVYINHCHSFDRISILIRFELALHCWQSMLELCFVFDKYSRIWYDDWSFDFLESIDRNNVCSHFCSVIRRWWYEWWRDRISYVANSIVNCFKNFQFLSYRTKNKFLINKLVLKNDVFFLKNLFFHEIFVSFREIFINYIDLFIIILCQITILFFDHLDHLE
jgi:hypothetical protein